MPINIGSVLIDPDGYILSRFYYDGAIQSFVAKGCAPPTRTGVGLFRLVPSAPVSVSCFPIVAINEPAGANTYIATISQISGTDFQIAVKKFAAGPPASWALTDDTVALSVYILTESLTR